MILGSTRRPSTGRRTSIRHQSVASVPWGRLAETRNPLGLTSSARARTCLEFRCGSSGLREVPPGIPRRAGEADARVCRSPGSHGPRDRRGHRQGHPRVRAPRRLRHGNRPDPAMLSELRRLVPDSVATREAAFEDLPLTPAYDLVFAAGSLHWTRPEDRWTDRAGGRDARSGGRRDHGGAGVCGRSSLVRPSPGPGIVGEPLMGLVLLVLVMTVVAGTLIGRSFRAGLETAVLALGVGVHRHARGRVPQASPGPATPACCSSTVRPGQPRGGCPRRLCNP